MKEFFKYRWSFLGILFSVFILVWGLISLDDDVLSLMVLSFPWSILIIFLEDIVSDTIFKILLFFGIVVNSLILNRIGQLISERLPRVLRIILGFLLILILVAFLIAFVNDVILN